MSLQLGCQRVLWATYFYPLGLVLSLRVRPLLDLELSWRIELMEVS